MSVQNIPLAFRQIVDELVANSLEIAEEQIDCFVKDILAAKRVFVAGAGRSGFAARAFSNRLMHLGFTVYYVGEPTTPAIREGDLLVIGSGSGNTKGPVSFAQMAQKVGATIATITINPENTIGSMAKTVIKLPVVTDKYTKDGQLFPTVQPVGNVFEQLSWLVYDTATSKLKAAIGQTQDQMNALHANME